MSSRVRVLTIDLQPAFLDPSIDLPDPHARFAKLEKALCIGAVRDVLRIARSRGWEIVHVRTVHGNEAEIPYYLRRTLGNKPSPLCPGDDPCTRLVPGLSEAGDSEVTKADFSAFRSDENLRYLEGCDELIVVGVAADCCVLQTAFDAARHEVHVVVPYQAVAASTHAGYVGGLSAISKSAGSVVDVAIVGSGEDLFESRLSGDDLEAALEGWFTRSSQELQKHRGAWRRLADERRFEEALEDIASRLAMLF